MTGATSPRLHLELMVARLLVPATDDTERGALARVERLERRVGIDESAAAAPRRRAARAAGARTPRPRRSPTRAPRATPPAPRRCRRRRVVDEPSPKSTSREPPRRRSRAPPRRAAARRSPLQQLRDAWPEILEVVQKAKRSAVDGRLHLARRARFDGDVLTLVVPERDRRRELPPGSPAPATA